MYIQICTPSTAPKHVVDKQAKVAVKNRINCDWDFLAREFGRGCGNPDGQVRESDVQGLRDRLRGFTICPIDKYSAEGAIA